VKTIGTLGASVASLALMTLGGNALAADPPKNADAAASAAKSAKPADKAKELKSGAKVKADAAAAAEKKGKTPGGEKP